MICRYFSKSTRGPSPVISASTGGMEAAADFVLPALTRPAVAKAVAEADRILPAGQLNTHHLASWLCRFETKGLSPIHASGRPEVFITYKNSSPAIARVNEPVSGRFLVSQLAGSIENYRKWTRVRIRRGYRDKDVAIVLGGNRLRLMGEVREQYLTIRRQPRWQSMRRVRVYRWCD